MAARMSGDVEYTESERRFSKRDRIPFAQGMGDLRNGFLARPEYWHLEVPQQFGHAADMVSMMMSQ